ncbi:RING/U-box superfamily protein [Striga hermonthica]|uniref:RING/U-box superfamily protein n=1 Tax=Striga hermonthica TaxID=68872 RepID=A0A9N7N5Y7_STRHE|nr:RING/U-box superfamily protein [Striga hermonthica]
MWNRVAGTIGLKHDLRKPTAHQYSTDCSDDEASSAASRDEEGLECPICWESFNLVENIPYVLWCGHTLCKNCIMGLQWAVVKFPTLPLQLPLFISCPWCNLLSLRLVYRGNLKFPRKNFFLLWMLESMNGDRVKSGSSGACGDHMTHVKVSNSHHSEHLADSVRHHSHSIDHNYNNNYFSLERLHVSLRKSLVFFVHLTAKFPLVIIFLLIILYAIPASAAILALYVLITVVFAMPSFLILYFAYPSLDWLVREIIT